MEKLNRRELLSSSMGVFVASSYAISARGAVGTLYSAGPKRPNKDDSRVRASTYRLVFIRFQ